jgi:hypothetical protein
MTTLIQTHRRCGGPVRPEARGILLESAAMTTTLKIDFVSDISCPWCAVGLGALEQALDTGSRARSAPSCISSRSS